MGGMMMTLKNTVMAFGAFLFAGLLAFLGLQAFSGSLRAETSLTAYAWNAYRGSTEVTEGSITIDIPSGAITLLQADAGSFMSGGDFVEDQLYMVRFGTGELYQVDTADGSLTLVGAFGKSDVTGFTYDTQSRKAYISVFEGGVSNLYEISLTDASLTLVGAISNGIIIGIAMDSAGNLYGIDLVDDHLYTINPETGLGTAVGLLGIDLNYAQDIAYDRDGGVLYGCLYTGGGQGGLYTIDTSTGAATLLASVEMEIDALAIPYEVQYEIAATAAADGQGTVSGAGTFSPGASVTLTAVPAPGYRFLNWTEGEEVVSEDATYTFTAEGNRTLRANFALQAVVSVLPQTGQGILALGGGVMALMGGSLAFLGRKKR